MKYYDGKKVYITGASSGMGLETAKLLSSWGADIALFARGGAKLEKTAAMAGALKKHAGQKISPIVMDVADPASVRKAIAGANAMIGAPDIVINFAGVAYSNHFERIDAARFDEIMKINVYGTRNVIEAALPLMRPGSVIANVASLAGLIGIYGYTAYGASKFAVYGMSECLRYEMKPRGIRVSVLCPPEVDTPMIVEESRDIPPEARASKNFSGRLDAQDVAKYFLRKMASGKFLIIPGFMARLSFRMQRMLPGLVFAVTWMNVRGAMKKAGRR